MKCTTRSRTFHAILPVFLFGLFLNPGAGDFADFTSYPTEHELFSVTSGDLDRDGNLDLIASSESGGRVTVFRNGGDGSFTFQAEYVFNADDTRMTVVTDLNLDGFPDLVVVAKFGRRFWLLRQRPGVGIFDGDSAT